MALIPCPECERKVSDEAEICPQCGYHIHKEPEEPFWSLDRWVKIAQISLPMIITVALAVVGMILTNEYEEDKQNQFRADTAIKVVDRVTDDEKKEAAAMLAFTLFGEG